ncbi:hypothetical protein D6D26_09431, partial [Aureobasidium pullulans]
GPLEAVDSSNVIQDHLQRYYARQDAYHSFSQCGRPHHRLVDPYLANTPHLVVYSQGKTGLEAILVISILIESFIFLLSSYLFGRLNMKVQNKLTVVTIFGMRLPLVLISAYFLVAFKRYTTQNNPSDIIYGTALYWQIALVGHSVLATAIQPLKCAATSFSTHSKMPVWTIFQTTLLQKNTKIASVDRDPSYTAPDILVRRSSRRSITRLRFHREPPPQDHIIVKKTDVQVTYSDDGRY